MCGLGLGELGLGRSHAHSTCSELAVAWHRASSGAELGWGRTRLHSASRIGAWAEPWELGCRGPLQCMVHQQAKQSTPEQQMLGLCQRCGVQGKQLLGMWHAGKQ